MENGNPIYEDIESVSVEGGGEMKIRRISDGVIFEVRKYVNGFGEESVWCDDWYGHHMIGRDCEFVNAYTEEDMNDFAEWAAIMQWIYDPTDKGWFQKHSSETKTTAQLRELWEKERKEATE